VHCDDVQGVVEAKAVLEPDGERGDDSREEADRGTAEGLVPLDPVPFLPGVM
jgi:hypothetical protein